MSAIRSRRKRGTWMALGATALAWIAAAALSLVGIATLADSRAGRLAGGGGDLPVQRLPYTPTALVGTIDDEGRLTTVAVLTIEPDGTGGSIVEVAASADANAGNAGVLEPLNAALAVRGNERLALDVEALTGVSFDVAELVDEAGFAQIVAPLGDLTVNMPIDLYDRSSGEQWPSGEVVMPGSVAARAVTAVDPMIEDWLFEPGRAAIWQAVARRVGAGIGSAAPVASDSDLPRPVDLDSFLDRLFAGPVQYRALSVRPLTDERIVDELPIELAAAFGAGAKDAVVVHDRAETLMVMGAVAPSRVGAPLEAPSFRVVMGFTDGELEAAGVTSSDVLQQAVNRLLFSRVNVVSVADVPGSTVPDHSTFSVVDASTVDGVREEYEKGFGDDIVVLPAQTRIDGIDIELTLGRDFLREVSASMTADVTGFGEDDSTEPTTPTTSASDADG
ncbi:MAG TPA: hypothetical protein VE487_09805 [Ilumatobacter sp.]|nr:hypothetical protein [Ilumatobacter sp.]